MVKKSELQQVLEQINSMDDKIDNKLEKIDGRLDELTVTSSQHEQTLVEHVRRTEILEMELKPIKDHVALVGAVGKILGALGALVGLALGIKTLLGF